MTGGTGDADSTEVGTPTGDVLGRGGINGKSADAENSVTSKFGDSRSCSPTSTGAAANGLGSRTGGAIASGIALGLAGGVGAGNDPTGRVHGTGGGGPRPNPGGNDGGRLWGGGIDSASVSLASIDSNRSIDGNEVSPDSLFGDVDTGLRLCSRLVSL